MNLVGETGSRGGAGIGASAQAAPANPSYTVGAVGFGPSWQDDEPSLRAMYDAACALIVRLECEADELRAEVALLREEQKILAERFDARLHGAGTTAEVKAAVTEGGTGGYPSAERPEPSPTFEDIRESCRDKEAADRIGGNPWGNI